MFPARMAFRAGVSSSMALVLLTRPLAPESWMGRERLGSSSTVRISTLQFGLLFIMLRVACRPFMTGIVMSITIASGFNSWFSSMASSPLEASPTTSQSSCVSKILRTPCRTMSWSSTMRIRGTRRSYLRNGLRLNHTNSHVAREYWKSCAFERAVQ